jgi:hypothetical protein
VNDGGITPIKGSEKTAQFVWVVCRWTGGGQRALFVFLGIFRIFPAEKTAQEHLIDIISPITGVNNVPAVMLAVV